VIVDGGARVRRPSPRRQCREPSRAATIRDSAVRRTSATSAPVLRTGTFGCGLSALGRQRREPSRNATIRNPAARRASATSAPVLRTGTFGCGLSALRRTYALAIVPA